MGFGDSPSGYAGGFVPVFSALHGARVDDQQLKMQQDRLALERGLQPLRQQLMELQVQSGRYENDVLAPLNKQIADLQLEQGHLNLGISKRQSRYATWEQNQRAAMIAKFPALAVAQEGEGLARIGTLNAQAESYKAQIDEAKKQGERDQQALDWATAKRDTTAASLFRSRQQVDSALASISDNNPGFTVTERERAGLYDAAARALDSGQVVPEQIPDLLSGYLQSLPRFQRRLDALPAIEAAAVGAPAPVAGAPQTPAAAQLQALQQKGVKSLSDAFAIGEAQRAAAAEAGGAADSLKEQAKRRGLLEWIQRAAAKNPNEVKATFAESSLTEEALNNLSAFDLAGLKSAIIDHGVSPYMK